MGAQQGTVTRLRVEAEGADAVVVRFVLAGDEGERTPVEMRGERVLGVLDEGDHVIVAEEEAGDRHDATLRPSTITNVTTGGTVELERPTRMTRAGRAIGLREIKNTAISAGVGGVIAVVIAQALSTSEATQGGVAPGPEDEASVAAVVLALSGIFLFLAALWLLVRRRLPERSPKWSPLVGFAIVLVAVGIALA